MSSKTNQESNQKKYVILEIQVDRTNEKGVFVATQILNVLHDTLEKRSKFPWKNSLTHRPKFTFEIVQIEGRIRFFFICEKQFQAFVSNQFYAQFPNIDITPVDNYLAGDKKLVYAKMKLGEFSYAPLKLYTEFKEQTEREVIDPFAAVTSALITGDKKLEVIQVNFVPLYDKDWKTDEIQEVMDSGMPTGLKSSFLTGFSWKKEVGIGMLHGPLKAMYLKKKKSEGEGDSDDKDKKTPGSRKTQDFGFAVSVAVGHENDDVTTGKLRLKEIVRSLNIFTSPNENGFTVDEVVTDEKRLFRNRQLPQNIILGTSELAGLVHLPTKYVQTPGINWILSRKFEPPHNLPNAQTENDATPIGKTNFRNSFLEFGSRPNDRRRHIYIIGKTGMGKSTLLENMIYDDIAKGRGVAVIDPHGDLAEKTLDFIPKSRTNDVILFNPADTDFPVAFNLLEDVKPELRPVVAGGFVNIFKRMFADSWGPRLEYILRNSILTLLEIPQTTMLDITKLLTNKGYRERTGEKVQDPVLQKFWRDEIGKWSPHQMNEAAGPILNKIGQFFSSYMIRNMIGQKKNSFSIRWAMDNKKILIMNLSKGMIGEDASNMLGAMLVTKFQIDAMSRADIPEDERVDFYLYVDEFQNFATSSFATILSEARKYKLNLTMANQYVDQMDDDVRSAVFGNVGSLVTFQVGHTDADVLAPALGDEEIVSPQDLLNLPKYQIYTKFLIDGIPSQIFSANTNPPIDVSDREKFQSHEKIRENSRMRYAKSREKIEKLLHGT